MSERSSPTEGSGVGVLLGSVGKPEALGTGAGVVALGAEGPVGDVVSMFGLVVGG
jgi:hypothetical protein